MTTTTDSESSPEPDAAGLPVATEPVAKPGTSGMPLTAEPGDGSDTSELADAGGLPVAAEMLWEASPDGLLIVDAAGTIRAASPTAEEMFGVASGALVGRSVETLVPQGAAERHRRLREEFHRSPRRRPMAVGMRLLARRGDTDFPVSIALSPLGDGGLVLAAVRDRTEYEAVEARLVESTRRRLLAAEHEHNARSLHDALIQELSALEIALRTTLPLIDDREAARRAGSSVAALEETIGAIRSLVRHAGSGAAPDTSGLRARSVEAVAGFVPSLGFEPTVAFRGPVDSAMPDGLHEHLVAALREGLSNAARHAGASQVAVSVTVAEGRVTARVSDDGCGPAEPGAIGGGLQNLSERAAAAGGTCEAQPGPDGGTVLTWHAPLP